MKSLVVSLPQCQKVSPTVTSMHIFVEASSDVASLLVASQRASVNAEQLGSLDYSVGAVGRDIWLCWYHCTLKMSSSLINPFLSQRCARR